VEGSGRCLGTARHLLGGAEKNFEKRRSLCATLSFDGGKIVPCVYAAVWARIRIFCLQHGNRTHRTCYQTAELVSTEIRIRDPSSTNQKW
jgi:hypothetical protein